jgi:hypothetical protein
MESLSMNGVFKDVVSNAKREVNIALKNALEMHYWTKM